MILDIQDLGRLPTLTPLQYGLLRQVQGFLSAGLVQEAQIRLGEVLTYQSLPEWVAQECGRIYCLIDDEQIREAKQAMAVLVKGLK